MLIGSVLALVASSGPDRVRPRGHADNAVASTGLLNRLRRPLCRLSVWWYHFVPPFAGGRHQLRSIDRCAGPERPLQFRFVTATLVCKDREMTRRLATTGPVLGTLLDFDRALGETEGRNDSTKRTERQAERRKDANRGGVACGSARGRGRTRSGSGARDKSQAANNQHSNKTGS